MKKILKCLAFVPMLFPLSVQAQGIGGGEVFNLPSYRDNVVPPSPGAAHIVKYSDTPVSYSLGLPDITIPIYTVKTRELELPITLTYHASGIRVDEVPGPVGMGWSLNAGGAVTKTVVGLSDDRLRGTNYVYKREELIPTTQDYTPGHMTAYLDGVIRNREDSYYDRYNYSYNGNSGSFIIANEYFGANNPQIIKTTLNDDHIEGYDGFSILDPYGNKYTFSERERVTFMPYYMYDPLQMGSTGYTTNSSYYLSRIMSADKTDEIILTYDTEEDEWTRYPISQSITSSRVVSDNADGQNTKWGMVNSGGNDGQTPPTRMVYSDCKYISSIIFEGGSVEFEYVNGGGVIRNKGLYINYNTTDNIPKRLKSIKIKEGDIVVKVFQMNLGIFLDGRYKLNGITVSNPSDPAIVYDSYTFNYYNELTAIPTFCAQDLFGYYNGKDDNSTLSHLRLLPSDRDHSAKRSYDFECAKTYALSDIITWRNSTKKTRTHFEYDPNKHNFRQSDNNTPGTYGIDTGTVITDPGYQDDGLEPIVSVPISKIDSVCIGLRIKSIETFIGDGDTEKSVKKRLFTYDKDRSDCTIDFTRVNHNCYLSRSQTYFNPYGIYTTISANQSLTLSNNSVLPGASLENAKVYYNRVIEDIVDMQAPVNSVRVEYIYDCDDSKAEAVYPDAEYQSSHHNPDISVGVVTLIKDWWKYVTIPGDVMFRTVGGDSVQSAYVPDIRFYFREKKSTFNNLTNKIIYKKIGSGYAIVEEEINTYKKFNTELIHTGLYVNNVMSWGAKRGGLGGIAEENEYRKRIENLPRDCYYFDVEEEVSAWKLVSSRRVKYFDDDSPASATGGLDYQPGIGTGGGSSDPILGGSNGGGQPGMGGLESGGSSTGSFDPGMGDFEQGIGALPFVRLKSETTRYYYDADPNTTRLETFQPKRVVVETDGDVYSREYKYPLDFANSSSLYNGMKGANNLYTVVEESVTKNDSDNISVRNEFAAVPISGNLTAVKLSSRTRKVNGRKTGESVVQAHDSYGNPTQISVDGMAPTCYIWSYQGKYPVAEIRNATYQQAKDALGIDNRGKYVIDMIPGSNTGLSGTQVDILKAIPNAMVTIYTYKPMVGISTVTDPSGRTSTFHYDAANRLSAVKDADGNLVETYEYKNF